MCLWGERGEAMCSGVGEIISVLDGPEEVLVDSEYLKELDHARDEDSADSRRELVSRLSLLCFRVKTGCRLRIAIESGEIVFSNEADFKNWCHARYPGVDYHGRRLNPSVSPPPSPLE